MLDHFLGRVRSWGSILGPLASFGAMLGSTSDFDAIFDQIWEKKESMLGPILDYFA